MGIFMILFASSSCHNIYAYDIFMIIQFIKLGNILSHNLDQCIHKSYDNRSLNILVIVKYCPTLCDPKITNQWKIMLNQSLKSHKKTL